MDSRFYRKYVVFLIFPTHEGRGNNITAVRRSCFYEISKLLPIDGVSDIAKTTCDMISVSVFNKLVGYYP